VSVNLGASWSVVTGTVSNFTIYNTPTITSLSPRSGPLGGDTVVFIEGSFYHTGVIRIKLGDVYMTSCVRLSENVAKCVTLPHMVAEDILRASILIDTSAVNYPVFSLGKSSASLFMYFKPPVLDVVTNYLMTSGHYITVSGSHMEVLDRHPGFFQNATCSIDNYKVRSNCLFFAI
jgi:hypothetical protein